jgi:hypothetical protein
VLWAALAAAAVVVVAGGGWAVWYRSTYHAWPGEGVPSRIHWCGRDYQRGPDPAISGAAASKALGGPLQPVMSVPPIDSHELYASRSAAAQQPAQRAGRSSGCATLVVLRTGADAYLVYELQGGL